MIMEIAAMNISKITAFMINSCHVHMGNCKNLLADMEDV